MRERPILFSAPMVRAILEGRKTQTRRVLKQATGPSLSVGMSDDDSGTAELSWLWGDGPGHDVHETVKRVACPYGKPGDHLWVRENGWERPERTPKMMRDGADTWERYYYDADGYNTDSDAEQFKSWGFKRRPSIHMPRWASRITLEVTGVRVERLQDISNEDARAEGVLQKYAEECVRLGHPYNAMDIFRQLWASINGAGSWGENPWVWVVEFRRIGNA